ncbi:ATP synthase F1 subunit delta [Candidatus Bipolaricaulota bacterium]|nr:ATP synthase F1 subunit delta [Candidatus Bipolaricaulota bacterium]
MKSIEVADRYAQAVYELGKEEGILDDLQSDLEEVNKVINTNDDFFPFLIHPLVPNKDKRALLEEVFEDSLSREGMNFLKLLVGKDREDYLPLIYRRVKKLRMDQDEIVEVAVAYPPRFDREEVVSRVEKNLREILDREVWITEVTEDEDLIGGVKLKVGERVIDGSAQGRLEGLRQFVLGG